MQIILITDNDINEVIAAYTVQKFIEEANKEYFEANDFCGSPEYFTESTLDFAIEWYINTSDNLSLDIIALESAFGEEVVLMDSKEYEERIKENNNEKWNYVC